jgi:hypothetical protein
VTEANVKAVANDAELLCEVRAQMCEVRSDHVFDVANFVASFAHRFLQDRVVENSHKFLLIQNRKTAVEFPRPPSLNC